MSLLYKFNILFYIILLQSWKLTTAPSVLYKNYNSFDMFKQDMNDYLDNNQPNTKSADYKIYLNDGISNEVPKSTAKKLTSVPPLSKIFTTYNTASSSFPESDNAAQAENIIEHIITIIKSMREHAIGIIRNMNELESDILSSSSSSKVDDICKNSSMALCDSMNGMKKIVYPDVLFQAPDYVTNEWSHPINLDEVAGAPQTNEFVERAQETVKLGKQQIENCKRILDNAVHNALLKANLESDIIADPLERGKQESIENSQKSYYNKDQELTKLPNYMKGEDESHGKRS